MSHVTPYEIKKECYLLRSCLGADRMLLFMVEQVFCQWGRFGRCIMMHKADTQYTEERKRRPKDRGKFLMFKLFNVFLVLP